MIQNTPTGTSLGWFPASVPIRNRVPNAIRNVGELLLTVNINLDRFSFATT